MNAEVTVLFVDDDPLVLSGVKRSLRDMPFETLIAKSGEEALEILRQRRIDVLVSDIDMPGMSGIDLVRRVRREHPSMLRMLITGAITMDRTLLAINEGEVQRFFVKPFDLELFRRTMSACADRIERLRREGEEEARVARRDELHRWVDVRFPGTLSVTRNDAGEVVVDVAGLASAMDDAGMGALDRSLSGEER